MNAPDMMPVMPRPDVNHPSGISIVTVTVRIVRGIPVPVISVPERRTKPDPHRDPCVCPRSRGKREATNCQANQKKLFPIHAKPLVEVDY